MAEAPSGKAAEVPAKPTVVVGLDFGTTYSGFAFAHVSNPDRIYSFYDYPECAGEKIYCKTLTACYYKPMEIATTSVSARWTLQSWGYSARSDYERDIQAFDKYRKSQEVDLSHTRIAVDSSQSGAASPVQQAPTVGVLLLKFKLHLATINTEASSATPLPAGLPVAQVITDYLHELGGLVLKHLQGAYGADFSSEMIRWCITVPSIWLNSAKATMKTCMVATGLVSAHHPLTIVWEAEAASFHFQRVFGQVLLKGRQKLLVADIGGGISDIVVHQVVKTGSLVEEVSMSSGRLCGSTYMDSRFVRFLEERLGKECVTKCFLKHPNVYSQMMKEWECTKCFFDRDQGVAVMNLPNKLAVEWERFDVESGHSRRRDYAQLGISFEEMQSIFDPVVEQIVDLIQRQMVVAGGKVLVLAMVGGFSESRYLLHRIREAFAVTAKVMSPSNPGIAICHGAVSLTLKDMSKYATVPMVSS